MEEEEEEGGSIGNHRSPDWERPGVLVVVFLRDQFMILVIDADDDDDNRVAKS